MTVRKPEAMSDFVGTFIHKAKREALMKKAFEQGVSVSKLIRDAIDRSLES
jgi:hypothetical protein